MIDYAKTKAGDILKIVGAGAPGWAANGSLVRVIKVEANGVLTERPDGNQCEFVFNCGAARLEPTEWTNDFPAQEPKSSEATLIEDVLAGSDDPRKED